MKHLPVLVALMCLGASTCSEAQTRISGSVRAADGESLPLAHVSLSKDEHSPADEIHPAQEDGSFSFITKAVGPVVLRFSGVDHAPALLPAWLDENSDALEIDVQLATYRIPEKLNDLWLIGDFNDFSLTEGAIKMEAREDGSFQAVVEWAEPFLQYQVLARGSGFSRSINGTMSEGFAYDSAGDYRSIVATVGNSVSLRFDPAQLPRSDKEARLHYDHPFTADYNRIVADMRRRSRAYRRALLQHREAGGSIDDFQFDVAETLEQLLRSHRLSNNGKLRSLYMLAYMHMATYGAAELNPAIVEQALADISALSPLWSLQHYALVAGLRSSGLRDRYEAYVQTVINKHRDSDLRQALMASEIGYFMQQGDSARALEFYETLTRNFHDTQYTRYAIKMFSPDRKVLVGKAVPEFRFVSMDNEEQVYTRESMLGQFYLLDFWATWCGPCIMEMADLHRAFEKFKHSNFTILSLSLDTSKRTVEQFRLKRWAMPWRHSLVPGGYNSAPARKFELAGVPTLILVNDEGYIVAKGSTLRGAELEKTLAGLLGDNVVERQ